MELPPVLASAPGLRAAELVIDGLSVCCFNRINAEKFWEVAYPHQLLHQLQITIRELDAAGQEVRTVDVQTVDAGVTSFDISLTNGSVEHYNQFPLGGPSAPNFDRTDPAAPRNNPHDLGWMIDLAGPQLDHGNVTLLPRSSSRPISLARFHHSLFCTLKPEVEEVRISPRVDNHPHAPNSRSLPLNNAEVVGVLLGTGPGEIRFDSAPLGSLNINPLPYSENQRYRIYIINTDTVDAQRVDPFVRGDLHLFYEMVIHVDGVEKELWAHPGGQFTPDGDCHPNIFGRATVEPPMQS
jgi:hypothetical protein